MKTQRIPRGVIALAVLVTGMGRPALADEPGAAPMEMTLKIVPSGSPQEAAVRASLNDALREGPPPRTLAEVEQRSARLTAALRQGGFAVGQVLMTQEDWQASTRTGQAVFTVFPGRVSEIEVENKSRMDSPRLQQLIAQALCGQPPEALDTGACLFETRRFERATQLLQDLPGVALDGAPRFGPGRGVGDVKTSFAIAQKGDPYSFGVSVDDNGTAATGRVRGTVSVSANNYFGLGEDYSASVTGTAKGMWTGALSGSLPILSDGLRLTGGLTRQQYTVTSAGTTFTGTSNTAMLGLTYPFMRGLDANLWGGLSYLHSQAAVNYRDFDFTVHSTMDALKLSLSANNGDRAQQLRTDQWGGQLALTFGRQRNDDALDTGPRRAGDYIKFTAAGFGSLALNPQGDFFVTGRANTQYGNRNLDASEQLGIGGPNAVRGYRIDEPSLNDGAVFNFGLYKRFPVAEGHQVQVGPILDFAYGRVNHTPWTGWERSYPGIDVKNTRRLASYGLEAAWLTPIGVTLTVSASKAFGFSDTSWVRAGKKPTQYWMTASWNH